MVTLATLFCVWYLQYRFTEENNIIVDLTNVDIGCTGTWTAGKVCEGLRLQYIKHVVSTSQSGETAEAGASHQAATPLPCFFALQSQHVACIGLPLLPSLRLDHASSQQVA
jgi:hypothetical protein